MKKHIILCLMAMFYFVGQSYAQNDQWRVEMQKKHKQQINDTLTNAKYVFEGVVVKQSYYIGKSNIMYSRIVRITKVFRGNIQPGTVEILKTCNDAPIAFGDKNRMTRDIYPDSQGVFICRKAKEFLFDSKYNIDNVDNKIILTPYSNVDYIALNYMGNAAEGLDTSFYTKGELYRYLGSFPHMKMPTLSAAESGDWEKPILLPRGSTHGMDTTFSSPRDFNTYQRTHKMVNRSDFYQDSIRQVNVAKEAKRLKEKQQNDSIVAAHHQQFLIRNQQKKMRNDSLKRIDSLNRINLNTLPATNSSTTASAKTSRLKDDSSPALMLLYNGTISARGIYIKNISADFVFDKNYTLAPLQDVASYIAANKHLQGVAPAAETEKSVNVGEFDQTLLQKVEELTLYMIELQKQNDLLKAKVETLEKAIH